MQKTFPLLLGIFIVAPALAQDPIVYPNQDQSPEQQQKDEFECYTWAKGETGFDPMQVPTPTEAPPEQQAKKGGAGRGALGGAAIGGIVDGSSGAKTGAAVGAVVGGARRGSQNKQQAQSQAQWEQEQAQIYSQNRGGYNRAYSACLEGRGYSVK